MIPQRAGARVSASRRALLAGEFDAYSERLSEQDFLKVNSNRFALILVCLGQASVFRQDVELGELQAQLTQVAAQSWFEQ